MLETLLEAGAECWFSTWRSSRVRESSVNQLCISVPKCEPGKPWWIYWGIWSTSDIWRASMVWLFSVRWKNTSFLGILGIGIKETGQSCHYTGARLLKAEVIFLHSSVQSTLFCELCLAPMMYQKWVTSDIMRTMTETATSHPHWPDVSARNMYGLA